MTPYLVTFLRRIKGKVGYNKMSFLPICKDYIYIIYIIYSLLKLAWAKHDPLHPPPHSKSVELLLFPELVCLLVRGNFSFRGDMGLRTHA